MVRTYRLYCLNEADEVVASEWINAVDEEEAIRAAKENHPDAHCELWLGERLIAKLRPD